MSPTTTVHIIGAGVAGLAAALEAAETGARVVVYESAAQAGGRCRSYYDKRLKAMIDNGNHLVLGANTNALSYLVRLGTLASCISQPKPHYSFIDLVSRHHWHFSPPQFKGIPWRDWLALPRLFFAPANATVSDCIPPESALFRQLIAPLTLATLNTPPDMASARMLAGVLKPLILGGRDAWKHFIPAQNLGATFIDPVLLRIKARGGKILLGQPVQAIETANGHVTALVLYGEKIRIGEHDRVICAASAPAARALLPDFVPDFSYSPIINAHFLWPQAGMFRETMPFLGVVGGHVQWIFFHEGRISTTTSAAHALADYSEDELAQLLWDDVCRALFIPQAKLPPSRVIREKRATIATTPANLAIRPQAQTPLANLRLAGDYLGSSYPPTIEAAVASGFAAGAWAVRENG